MTDLKVGHAGLDLASQDLGTASQNLDALRQDLNAELDKLKPNWTGAAQDAYTPARAQWDGAVDDMIVLLRDLSAAVKTSNENYLAADLQGSRLFS